MYWIVNITKFNKVELEDPLQLNTNNRYGIILIAHLTILWLESKLAVYQQLIILWPQEPIFKVDRVVKHQTILWSREQSLKTHRIFSIFPEPE